MHRDRARFFRQCWRVVLAAGVYGAISGDGWAAGGPIRPLANDYVVVGESPDPANVPLYSPTIVRLDDGRLVAGYTENPNHEVLLTSDDGGRTWTERAQSALRQGRLFRAGSAIYYIATGVKLGIIRSLDRGETWSAPSYLRASDPRSWQGTPANVWHTRGHVYLAYEHLFQNIDAWAPSEKALVLLRAAETDDLTQPAAWTYSSELVFADVVPGVRENTVGLDLTGVPFFNQAYPGRAPVGGGRSMSPIGWVEPGVVQIVDPNHAWYDPTGHTFHLLARAHTGGTGFAALTKVVENADGSMTMSLEKMPSGNEILFVPCPVGQMRFHVLYDDVTQRYWLLGSQPTDSMTRADLLPPERYDLPNNERHRLVLYFSRNLVDWCFAGLVAKTSSPREARHYASMDIDGDDLVILSRSGDARAKSAHNGNIITFHRVHNFRDLVY